MDVKIKVFLELLRTLDNIECVVFNEKFEPNFDLSNNDNKYDDFYSFFNVGEIINDQVSDYNCPVIIETQFGLKVIACFKLNGKKLEEIYILGPILSLNEEYSILEARLKEMEIGSIYINEFMESLSKLRKVPLNLVISHAISIHYLLTGEKLLSTDINIIEINSHNDPLEAIRKTYESVSYETHYGIWANEVNLLNKIREGDPKYNEALVECQKLSSGVRIELKKGLRKVKNDAHVLLTLVSRAAIEGGVQPSIGYSMHDYYALKIEQSSSQNDILVIIDKFMCEFVEKVQEANKRSLSPEISLACNHIALNLNEKIKISDIAGLTNYTTYYLSSKFKKEVGLSINEYARKLKIDTAKNLLKTTSLSINEISDTIGCRNRSYFYTLFLKEVGISPSEYRDKSYINKEV